MYGSHNLIESIVILCKKDYMCLLGYSIVLERRECDFNLNDCFFGGVKDVGDIFEAQSQGHNNTL